MRRIIVYLFSLFDSHNPPMPFRNRAGSLVYAKTNERSNSIKTVWCLVLVVMLSGLLGCDPDPIDNGPIPDITVTGLTSEAIQTAINRAPARGAHIILPPGDYRATALVSLTGKNNITIDGQGKANWIGSSTVPNLFALRGTCRNIRLTGINFSTTAGPGKYTYGLVSTFEQSFVDGYEIDHCQFTAPNAPINLINFLPYSPINELGNGRGAMQRNIYIHDCIAKDGGRAFCEVNSHVHADGKTDVYFENFRFSNNTVTNMGTQDASFGPALSMSGIGRNVTADSNNITDTKYCGLEFVNTQTVSSMGNRFTDSKNGFNAYSVSQAGNGKTTNVRLTNNSGTVKGRAYALHDIESFTVTGGTFTADQKIELIRAKNGSMSQINLTVTNDVNAMLISGSEAVELINSRLMMTNATNATSVIVIPATSQRIVVQNDTLSRPASATGAFVLSETSSGNLIGPNVERNN